MGCDSRRRAPCGRRASCSMSEPRPIDETLYEIPATARADMRVPARVFADEELLAAIRADRSLEQLQNVATLPGIVEAAIAMPDIHQGYGFPVGGLAATEPPDGVAATESEGCLEGADPEKVSARARERGADQLGTVGSGNHFIELQRID